MKLFKALVFASLTLTAKGAYAQQGTSTRIVACSGSVQEGLTIEFRYATVTTQAPLEVVLKQWQTDAPKMGIRYLDGLCRIFPTEEAVEAEFRTRADRESAESYANRHKYQNQTYHTYSTRRVAWTPELSQAAPSPASPRRTATVSYNSPDPKKGENGYLRATFKVEYQLIACFGELHIAYSLVDRSVALAAGGYRIGNEVYTKVADPDPALNSVDLEGAVLEPTKHLVGRFRDRNAGKALGFGCFPGQTQKIAILNDILGADAKPERIAAYLEGLYATFTTRDFRKSAEVETAVAQEREARLERIRQGNLTNQDYAAEHIIERAAVERERQAAEIAQREKVQAQYAETRRRQEEFQRQEQERLATYNRQIEEHQRQVDAAAEARRQFEQKQAQYERERAAWEAQTAKLRR